MEQRILVVSDNKDTRADVVQALENHGFEVFVTDDEDRALGQFGFISPELTILDLFSANRDRWETLRGIRAQSSVPVIAITPHEDSGVEIESLDRGADIYLCKPFDGRELRARVRALLRRARIQARGMA